jgi:hypothetical protein
MEGGKMKLNFNYLENVTDVKRIDKLTDNEDMPTSFISMDNVFVVLFSDNNYTKLTDKSLKREFGEKYKTQNNIRGKYWSHISDIRMFEGLMGGYASLSPIPITFFQDMSKAFNNVTVKHYEKLMKYYKQYNKISMLLFQYSEIKRYIINKKSLWGSGVILFLFVIFIYLSYAIRKDFSFSLVILIVIIICILFIINILTNLYRCCHFYKLYKNELNKETSKLCKIIVEKKKYKVKVPIKSYDMEILSMPKSTNAVCVESDKYLLLFFSVHYLGIFQQVLNPFIFTTKNDYLVKDKKTTVIYDFEIIKTANKRIIYFPNEKLEIKSITLPRLTEILPP